MEKTYFLNCLGSTYEQPMLEVSDIKIEEVEEDEEEEEEMTRKMKKKFHWTWGAKIRLLELARNEPCMWNQKVEQYFLKIPKWDAQKRIAKSLALEYPELRDLQGSDVKRKFSILRCTFMREYKKIQNVTCGSVVKPKWKLYKHFSYILSGIAAEPADSNLMISSEAESSSEPDAVISIRENACKDNTSEIGKKENHIGLNFLQHKRQKTRENHMEGLNTFQQSNIKSREYHVESSNSFQQEKQETRENPMEGLDSFQHRKLRSSPMATSMSLLVETVVDKLPYSRQIWFAQKLTNLIAEANNLPVEKG